MKEAILSVLLTLPRAPSAETAHLPTVAAAIESATLAATCQGSWRHLGCTSTWQRSRVELASLLVTLGHLESGFMPRIQAGDCRVKIGECDGGRARSYWQFQHSAVTHKWWHHTTGLDYYPTVYAALAASASIGRAVASCKTLEGGIARYATGARCEWKGAASRVRMLNRVDGQLRHFLVPGDDSIKASNARLRTAELAAVSSKKACVAGSSLFLDAATRIRNFTN